MLWRGGIKRGLCRKMLSRPEVLVPLAALNPLSGGRLLRSLAHQFRYLVLALAAGCVDIIRAIGGVDKMNMRVDKAGQHCLPAQVNDLSVSISHAPHLVIIPHCYNAPACAIYRHRLGAWLRRVHRINCSVQIQQDTHAYCLDRKYTLTIIKIPPMMVVGSNCSRSSTIASAVPKSGWINSAEAAAEPSTFASRSHLGMVGMVFDNNGCRTRTRQSVKPIG